MVAGSPPVCGPVSIRSRSAEPRPWPHGAHQLARGYRPIHTRGRLAAIVIVAGRQAPAFMGLALDEGLTRFALRVERVEVLLGPSSAGWSPALVMACPFLRSPLRTARVV